MVGRAGWLEALTLKLTSAAEEGRKHQEVEWWWKRILNRLITEPTYSQSLLKEKLTASS